MPATMEQVDFVDEFERKTLGEGVRLFNQGRYFEAHEKLEPLWLKADQEQGDLFRGLIRAALCYRNLETNNFAGAKYLVDSAIQDLKPFEGTWVKGMDVSSLLKDLLSNLVLIEELERSGGEWNFDDTPQIPWSMTPPGAEPEAEAGTEEDAGEE